jgi:aminoglycoside/choline kinase family phosphotransferase
VNLAAPPGREADIAAFLAAAGWAGAARRRIAGDASFRRYDRLTRGGASTVLMDAPPPEEDVRPFVAVAGLLRAAGLSAPAILAADERRGLLLLEDFGDDTYARLLAGGAAEAPLYELAVDVLVALRQRVPAAAAAPLPAFDEPAILAGVERFIDWYWPAVAGRPAVPALRESFLAAWRAVLPRRHALPDGMALFDYHVDNLMLLSGRDGLAACGLLDFQGAVRAPLCFDLMSLVEDARRDLSPGLAPRLVARYRGAFPADRDAAFALAWAVMGAQRHVRILGTFARLRLRDGKAGYAGHMPRIWRYLEAAVAHPALAPVAAWLEANLPVAWRGLPAALAEPGR